MLLHGDVPSVDEVVASFSRVTPDDVRRVADRLLASPPTLAVVSPLREERVAAWVA